MDHFSRKDDAAQIAAALSGVGFSDAPNGLFLAAPRRTGKSTFLQQDLKPALEKQGVVVIYVDLWADQARDPATLIAAAITEKLLEHAGLISQFAVRARVKEVAVAGALKIDTSSLLGGAQTLTEALKKLSAAAKKPVALMVDEAQQALTTEQGHAMMAGLKSARDQMNSPGDVRLMLIMTGSDRDKLLRLVNTSKAPFFGSNVTPFKPLGRAFIEHVAQQIESDQPRRKPVDIDTLQRAFETFGSRPQFFINAIGAALSPISSTGEPFEQQVLNAAHARVQSEEEEMEQNFLGLTRAQQAVLWRLLEQASAFKPYDGAALAFYEQHLGERLTPQQVQNALQALRERNPSIVWKSLRGEYATEDAALVRWFAARKQAGTWPPGGELTGAARKRRTPRR
jgi:hypothetical protein